MGGALYYGSLMDMIKVMSCSNQVGSVYIVLVIFPIAKCINKK